MQKYRSQSQHVKEVNTLPHIKNKGESRESSSGKKPLFDKYDQYLSAKLDKAIDDKKGIGLGRDSHKNNLLLLTQRENQVPKKTQPPSPVNKLQGARSTPKLHNKSRSPSRPIRPMETRYLSNWKLSMELKLDAKAKNNSDDDSDQTQIQNAMMKDDKVQKVQPIVFLIKKNVEYNPVGDDSRFYMTQNSFSSSRMEIRQNSQSFPMVPNIPNRSQRIHPLPKGQKYIKQKFVGQEAINKFYNRYKNIQKVRQMQHFKAEFNPLTTILTILQSYNIPPKKMEIIKLKGQEAILDLKNCALGGGISIKAIAEIIQKVSIFQEIDLSSNQITADLTDVILPNLLKMKRVNLSYNRIGRRGIEWFTKIFYEEDRDQDCEMDSLNLQANNLGDGVFGNFFVHMGYMNYLTVLNLSKNSLGTVAANKLRQFFRQDTTLAELYLHWCELGTKATKIIFQGLAKNFGLRVLDLSWNQIGFDCIPTFLKFLKTNQYLTHLDISYCQIDQLDTRKIARALKLNHTIYGLHYQGNQGYVDFKGHLHPIKKQHLETPISIRAGLIQRIHSVNIITNYYRKQPASPIRNICWICQGWEEKYFKINKQPGQKACFIHLDFQFYNGVMMKDMGSYFQILRMCPPKSLTLFYTRLFSKDSFVHTFNNTSVGQVKIVDSGSTTLPDFVIDKTKFSGICIPKMNKIHHPRYVNQIFNEDYLTKIHCQPRSDDMKIEQLFVDPKPKQKKKPKKLTKKPKLMKEIDVKHIPDDFDNIFNKRKNVGDGQTYQTFIKNCVDFDFKHSKVTKIIKNQGQLAEVRSILENNYDLFQKIYYYLVNNNPSSSGVYSISQTRFQKFVEQQSYQTKRMTKAKIRLKLVSCLASGSTDSQIQWFYRPQFFQFLLRVAIQKWCCVIPKKQNQTQEQRKRRQKYPLSISEAFARMIKTLKKYEQKADPSKWKDQNLTSYDMTIVVKSYSYIFQQIYQKYAGLTQKNLNTKSKKKMLLEEYKTMMLQAEIRKTKQALKDLQIAFRTSKELQVEDGIQDTGLDYVQFLQTFCRFADGMYLIPVGIQSNPLWQKQVIKSNDIPLFLKVQKLLKELYNKNYDLHTKKFDQLFQTGLFPEQVAMLMQYYKQQFESKQSTTKTFVSINAKMNSLENKSNKITLKDLIEMVQVKANQILEINRAKMMQAEAEQERLDRERKKNNGIEEESEEDD